MANVPPASTFTTAPLRHRLRVELNAPIAEVWALVGAHERLSEYSAGIERVEVTNSPRGRVCYFGPQAGPAAGLVSRERIVWEEPKVGYVTSTDPDNDFGLINDVGIVTVATTAQGTLLTWEQYYDHQDLAAARASFDEGIADIGQRLVDRFGGRVLERFVDGP